jgi:hypothetical protein
MSLLPKPYRLLVVLALGLAPSAPSTLVAGAEEGAVIELGPILTLAEEDSSQLAIGKGLGGDVLVAWSTPYGVSEGQVRALRLAATGRALGPPFVVYRTADHLPGRSPEPGWNLKVAPGVGRGFLLTWDDGLPGGLVARRVRGRENEVVEGFEARGAVHRAAAVALAQGRFLLVHERYDGRLAAQRFDPEGRPVGAERELAHQGLAPAVVRDAEGNVLVASFAPDPRDARRNLLWVRRFAPDGSPVGPRRLLDARPFTSQSAGVRGATGSGGISAFSWEREGQVRLQLIGPDGGLRGRTIDVALEPELAWHDVAMDSAGRALVVWVDCCMSGASARARLWSPSGRPLSPAFVVASRLREVGCCLGNVRQPAVAARGRGDFFVAWLGENGEASPRPGIPAVFGIRVSVLDRP